MKHKISKVAATMLLASSLPVSAEMCSSFNPYVGADAQYRYMPFAKGFGDNLFKKTSPQANLFIGNRFNEYFSLELAYNTSKKVKRSGRVGFGQLLAGVDPFLPGDFFDFNANSKISGISMNATFFLPIESVCGLEAVGSLGISRAKINTQYRLVADHTGPIDPPIRRTFSARHAVMRLGGGLQYKILENLSIRALINWENTARFKNLTPKEALQPPLPTLKLKNSIVYSLGLVLSY